MTPSSRDEQSITGTLAKRNKAHGDFTLDATKAQELKRVFRSSPNWDKLSFIQREAMEMLATKLARILVGDPNHADHWHDIAGYATLVERRL